MALTGNLNLRAPARRPHSPELRRAGPQNFVDGIPGTIAEAGENFGHFGHSFGQRLRHAALHVEVVALCGVHVQIEKLVLGKVLAIRFLSRAFAWWRVVPASGTDNTWT